MADNEPGNHRFAARCYTKRPPKVEWKIFESKRRDHRGPQYWDVGLLAPSRADASVCLDVGPLGTIPEEQRSQWVRFTIGVLRGGP
jgi:hypothetical protein